MDDRTKYLTAIQEQVIAIRRLARAKREPVKAAYFHIVAADLEQRIREEDVALCSPE